MLQQTKHTRRGLFLQVAWWAIKLEWAMRLQRTFVYCPRCNFEMYSMNNAIINKKNNIVIHVCKNCGVSSHWDYGAPTPINIT